MHVAAPGGDHATDRWPQELAEAASWVRDFVGSSYGPFGGHKLSADGDLVTSGAAALADLPIESRAMEPFIELAHRLRAAGDQASGGVLLAASLVHEAQRAERDGVPLAAILEGLAAAHRQAAGWLRARTRTASPAAALAAVDFWGIAPDVVDGLGRLERAGRVDLDCVAVETGDASGWSDGLVVTLDGPRGALEGPVLLLHSGPTSKPSSSAVWRDPAAARAAEESRLRLWLEAVEATKAVAVFCRGDLGDAKDRLPMLVAHHVPADLAWRIERATGASAVVDMDRFEVGDLGCAALRPRPHRIGGYILGGPGPGATLTVPRSTPPGEHAAKEQAEALLRAAGVVLADSRVVPGGGRWQTGLAESLLASAAHLEGKQALGVECAAHAVRYLAWCLLSNAGRDPLDGGHLEPVDDAAVLVQQAMLAAFDTAIGMLRIDARHAKKPSQGTDLRGGDGPMGSLKGMPGDIPPLM